MGQNRGRGGAILTPNELVLPFADVRGMLCCIAVHRCVAFASVMANYVKQHIILASAVSCVDVRRLTMPYIAENCHTWMYVDMCACRMR